MVAELRRRLRPKIWGELQARQLAPNAGGALHNGDSVADPAEGAPCPAIRRAAIG